MGLLQSICVTLPNFMLIGSTLLRYGKFVIFQSYHMGFIVPMFWLHRTSI